MIDVSRAADAPRDHQQSGYQWLARSRAPLHLNANKRRESLVLVVVPSFGLGAVSRIDHHHGRDANRSAADPRPSHARPRQRPAGAFHTLALRRATLITLAGVVFIGAYFASQNALCLAGPSSSSMSAGIGGTMQSDPRPTIYSGQVSFGLLLSAHSSLSSDISTAASSQSAGYLARLDDDDPGADAQGETSVAANASASTKATTTADMLLAAAGSTRHSRRQIFERPGHTKRQHGSSTDQTGSVTGSGSAVPTACTQVNPNALYAGMGAIWTSHQANLVGDSQLTIGTYVYDSCNDLDVGQRQSVRIVSNLNAFQQTTCESPRGSPISITVAHGDNQLRAIQLLTSFRVPVITTKENFALEDYNQLTRDQRRFLFSTAPSSRYLAVGALRFSRRIVNRSTASPKLANQFHKMSSRNGLIIISRNLPSRFISYLAEMIPNHVNYEMLQSNQPIDQIRSVESLESVLIKPSMANSGAESSPKASFSTESGQQPTTATPADLEADSTSPTKSREKRFVNTARALHEHDEEDFRDAAASEASSSGSDAGMMGEFDGSSELEQHRMLSPTILLFITASEAIDLVTRLRNDLAEVSRYYSLIVATREDITPALKTIFHRGGSRLCSGKAFYTISPRPDEINEFSRYFRDTVQMEGETSDHPLVCEYARHQATSKQVNADLDDISTEPVIKAVWSAASAIKSVYRRECGHSSGQRISSVLSARESPADITSTPTDSSTPKSHLGSRQLPVGATRSECMQKMGKNMSLFVQRALKRLDVTINSTGLQALDGFRIRFDEMNELMTNKFSIKYINKECEIIELGQFSGVKDSSLHIDEDSLAKSLESTLPDPWPVAIAPTPTSTVSSRGTSTGVSSYTSSQNSDSSPLSGSTEAITTGNIIDSNGDSTPSNEPTSPNQRRHSRRKGNRDQDGQSTDEPPTTISRQPVEDEEARGPNRAENDRTNDNSENLRRGNERTRFAAGGDRLTKRRTSDTGRRQEIQTTTPGYGLGSRGAMFDAGGIDQRGNSFGGHTTQPATEATLHTTTQRPMRRLKPFPTPAGTDVREWLPTGSISEVGKHNSAVPGTNLGRLSSVSDLNTRVLPGDDEQVDGKSTRSVKDLRMKGTTETPTYATLPESGGNTDLDMPPHVSTKPTEQPGRHSSRLMETAATTETSDFVTLPTASGGPVRNTPITPTTEYYLGGQPSLIQDGRPVVGANYHEAHNMTSGQRHHQPQPAFATSTTSQSYTGDLGAARASILKDLDSSPIPLSAHQSSSPLFSKSINGFENLRLPNFDEHNGGAELKSGRSRIRSHLKWIYNSWFAMSVLGANIFGALLTLYVLTFLLMKNCDGSLDRENQGLRSMHLLAIIIVFFGSTLFIVYPTPGLCLLRTSWHNFALAMLFGSLLIKTMQARSNGSLGLGGRPNRLNDFLTLIFMVGVQVSFELQRWKYESANYIKFVNHYFGSSENDYRKLMVLGNAVTSQFNPLNSFNDQVTPVSIQVSEQYQNLLQDYCMQHADDFLQSQIYLCIIVGLLVIFSFTTRNSGGLRESSTNANHNLTTAIAGGKLITNQHEANLNMGSSHFHQFASNVAGNRMDTGNILAVTLASAPIYYASLALHMYGQDYINHDLIYSITMVLIAFVTLIGVFLPTLIRLHRHNGLNTENLSVTVTRPALTQPKSHGMKSPHSSTVFTMFPEFVPTGHRRPSSASGDSSSGAGSRRPFMGAKESRRNMGTTLASIVPSDDRSPEDVDHPDKIVDVLSNPDCITSAKDEPLRSPAVDDNTCVHHKSHTVHTKNHTHQQLQHNRSQPQAPSRRANKDEKRLIMLDVDPCCPRHGFAAWPKSTTSRRR